MAKEGGAALCALNQRVEADLLSVEELASLKILWSTAAVRETISGKPMTAQSFPLLHRPVEWGYSAALASADTGNQGWRSSAGTLLEARLPPPCSYLTHGEGKSAASIKVHNNACGASVSKIYRQSGWSRLRRWLSQVRSLCASGEAMG